MTKSLPPASASRLTIFKNTYLQAPLWLHRLVVRDSTYEDVLDGVPTNVARRKQRALKRLLWFWPRIDQASKWADADTGTAWAPENYLHSHRTRLVQKINEVVPKDASLLELGCNCGSDLNILATDGYCDLSGMDASSRALDLFRREYPATYALAKPRHDLFQSYLMAMPSLAVDYTYSNGATIELVHPSFPIVREICRVTRKGVLLDLSERHQGFARDYRRQFARSGFEVTFCDETEQVTGQSSLIVFLRKA